jgi:hypothetical protein
MPAAIDLYNAGVVRNDKDINRYFVFGCCFEIFWVSSKIFLPTILVILFSLKLLLLMVWFRERILAVIGKGFAEGHLEVAQYLL